MTTFLETQQTADKLYKCLNDRAFDASNPIEAEYYRNLVEQFLPVLQSLNRLDDAQKKANSV